MKSKETAITVKNLDIYYKEIKRFSIAKSGFNGFANAKKFHAVKNVSFEVKKGEIKIPKTEEEYNQLIK